MKSLLDLTNIEAKEYFLKEESYFNNDLPLYFSFGEMLKKVSDKIEGKCITTFYGRSTDGKGCDPCLIQ